MIVGPHQLGLIASTRGGGGGGAFSPADIADLVGWYEADHLALNDGDAPTSWPDKSGLGNDLTSVSGNPTYQTQVINGWPVVRFDGATDRIGDSTLAPTTGKVTVFIVLDAAGGEWHRMLSIGEDNASNGAVMDFTAEFGIRVWGGNEIYATAASGAFELFTARLEGPDVLDFRAWLNGSEMSVSSSASQTIDVNAGVYIGNDSDSGNGLEGDIAEVLIYDRQLTDSERQDVENHLISKYAL